LIYWKPNDTSKNYISRKNTEMLSIEKHFTDMCFLVCFGAETHGKNKISLIILFLLTLMKVLLIELLKAY